MYKVIMPKLGMAQSYCIIERWHKNVGDKIEKGSILLEVSTDKITFEIEAKESGYLLKVLRKELEEVPVAEVIAYIGEKDEFADDNLQSEPAKNDKVIPENIKNLQKTDVSALAKKLAEVNKIDIILVKGTGPGGRIMKEDVEAFIQEKKTGQTKIQSRIPLTSLRKIIAEKMSYSNQNIPHISQSTKADVTKLAGLKEKLKIANVSITYTDFFIRAAALSLRDNIKLNSSLVDNEHIIYEDINIGLVVSVNGGLIIPVIQNSDKKSISEIANEREVLIEKSQKDNLNLHDISNGTFSISNLGMFKVRSLTAIIYPPQSSILTIGSIYSNPEVVNNEIGIRKVIELGITIDHRILDGSDGAMFLTRLIELLENPELLT
jgi:pyruvate dehydrogenase E2 component (dihydrolipoamide acetyltransferase)